ncbi:MAG: helix-turn-helix domain-containing protein [Gaiellaceae bacterium]
MKTETYRSHRRALPRLRERRRELGLSERELAGAGGISPQFLRTLERGETRCRPEVASRLADRLDLDVDELFEGRDEPRSVGVNEASRRTGIHRKTIRKAIQRGELQVEDVPKEHMDEYVIPLEELDRWRGAWEARRSALRDELLAGSGGCGSPSCSEPECDIPHGGCHRKGCERPAAIAKQTTRRQRGVKGEPTRFCETRCAVLWVLENVEHPVKRLSRSFAAWRVSNDLVTLEDTAKQLDRSRAATRQLALTLGVGRRFEGFHWDGAWAFSAGDIDILAAHIAGSVRSELHRDPQRRARWYEARFASTKLWGRLGGPKVKYSEEQERDARELLTHGYSIRELVAYTQMARSWPHPPLSKRQVERIRKLSPNPL